MNKTDGLSPEPNDSTTAENPSEGDSLVTELARLLQQAVDAIEDAYDPGSHWPEAHEALKRARAYKERNLSPPLRV